MRVAVVGTGISGLYAARQLAPRCDLTLFEAQGHAGGHSNTVEVAMDGQRFAIDTGFIVFNEKTYPLFTALLQSLGVAYQPSEMSFSFRCEASGLEYRGDNNFDAIFAQRRNAFRPSFYGMLRDILRFNSLGAELVAADPAVTLGTASCLMTTSCPWRARSGPPSPPASSRSRRRTSVVSSRITV